MKFLFLVLFLLLCGALHFYRDYTTPVNVGTNSTIADSSNSFHNTYNKKKTTKIYSEEEFIRQYIKYRYEIGEDIVELEKRWGTDGEVYEMTNAPDYDLFWERMGEKLIQEAKETGLTRSVEILNVRSIPREDGQKIWEATISLIDIRPSNKEAQKTDWTVTILLEEKYDYVKGDKVLKVCGYGQKLKKN